MGSRDRCSMAILVLSAVITGLPVASPSSEYEGIGPLKVVLFQTSRPPWWVRLACNAVAVAGVPSDASYVQPPVRLLLAAPSQQAGGYPVFIFKHGTNVANCEYSQLLDHIASYGYIVVAPQAAFVLSCSDEIDETAKVVNWLSGNLALLLSSAAGEGVTPDLERVFLAGHSRGAKVVFALALGLTKRAELAFSNFSGLVALDPVDAVVIFRRVVMMIHPPIVTRSACELGYPTLIQGTGLGGNGRIPCAPAGYNHQAYFACTSAPIAYHLLASQYGHMDFLNNDSVSLTRRLCASGRGDTALMPFTAGLVLSFLDSALHGTTSPMEHILANWQTASIQLDEPQCSSYQTNITCPGMPCSSSLSAVYNVASA